MRRGAMLLDYDNDGLLDLLVGGAGRAPGSFATSAAQWVDVTRTPPAARSRAAPRRERAVADVRPRRRQRHPAASRRGDGAVRLWRNEGGSRSAVVRVQLAARVSNRSGPSAPRWRCAPAACAESSRRRRRRRRSRPRICCSASARRTAADIVRVLWPSGILQTELAPLRRGRGDEDRGARSQALVVPVPVHLERLALRVRDRLSRRRRDGRLGRARRRGITPDPDEYVRIRGDQLRARGGRYELRITNELEEAMFLDRVQLVAVDHPRDVEVYPNEGLRDRRGRPSASMRHVGARRRDGHRRARSRRAAAGAVARSPLSRRLRALPDSRLRGDAQLTIDLARVRSRACCCSPAGPTTRSRPTTSRRRRRDSRCSRRSCRCEDADGHVADGHRGHRVSGRPSADDRRRSQRAASPARRARSASSRTCAIYWDQILVDTSPERCARPRLTRRVDPESAALQSRGFSAESLAGWPASRSRYDYARVSTTVAVEDARPGVTRDTGMSRRCCRAADDMFAIAAPGDEIALTFDAAAFPPLRAGFARTFLLYADGFSKEMNIRSATPDTRRVRCRFTRCAAIPTVADERYPTRRSARAYRERYNTRDRHRAGAVARPQRRRCTPGSDDHPLLRCRLPDRLRQSARTARRWRRTPIACWR